MQRLSKSLSTIGLLFQSMDSAHTIAEAAQWEAVSVPLDSTYKGFVLVIVTAICYPLLLFFVALRSYVRIWVPRSFALDDGKGYYLLQIPVPTYHY